jgi:HPt (histidine-containing phosphotransfer) domain-containing protein
MDEIKKNELTVEQQIAADLALLWKEYKSVIFVQLAVIEDVSRAAVDKTLTEELRVNGIVEAHKLAGSVGSFGFIEGSRLAAEIEKVFRSGAIDESRTSQLSSSVAALRRELEKDLFHG